MKPRWQVVQVTYGDFFSIYGVMSTHVFRFIARRRAAWLNRLKGRRKAWVEPA